MGRKGKFLVLLFSAMMIFGMVGISSAAVYLSDLYVNPGQGSSHDKEVGYGTFAESQTFNLSLNNWTNNTQLTGARLYLKLYDEDPGDAAEATLVFSTGSGQQIALLNSWPQINGRYTFDGWINIPQFRGGIDIWQLIENDSTTGFKLVATGTESDFIFVSARLEGTTATPEPGTMMLLGSGLVGLAGWGRKKLRK